MGIIADILQEPFSNRTLENKIKILIDGKPRPILNTSSGAIKDQSAFKLEVLDPEIYDKVPWLTGCDICEVLCCWPCLLFNAEFEVWQVTELSQLSNELSLHENIPEHIQATLNFKTFTDENLTGVEMDLVNDEFNQLVNKNREILKLFIDAMCIAVASDDPSLRINSCQIKISPDICIKAFNVLNHNKNPMIKYFEDAVKWIDMSPTLLDDLIDSMTKVVHLAVLKEVKMSTYASLIISGHSTSPTNSLLSVVLRYIINDKICERFLGSVIISGLKTIGGVFDIIRNTIETFEISSKFLSYSFDGAVLETNKLSDLIELIQSMYPQSYFVPCYFQGIQDSLLQSLSTHSELTYFLEHLTAMEVYFHKDSKQRKLLEYFMFLNISREKVKWYVKAPFIKILRRCRKHFIEALKCIVEDCIVWSSDDNIKSKAFLEFLDDFHTVFLIHVLYQLHDHITPLDESLNSMTPETEFHSHIVTTVERHLLSEKFNFREHFNSAIEEMGGGDIATTNSLREFFGDHADSYNELYIYIINHMRNTIALRFCKLKDLSFCSLVNVFILGVDTENLSYDFLKLGNTPKLPFNFHQFASEMVQQIINDTFVNKNAYDMLDCFKNATYETDFPCTKKLLEFTLTMPFRPPIQDGDLSKFQKIKNLFYSTEHIKESGDASVLHVESEFLCDVQNEAFFYYVLQTFYEVNKSVELKYRRKNI